MPEIDKTSAEAIHKMVRDAFTTHKSSNKLYMKDANTVDTTTAKGKTRSTNQALAASTIDDSRAKSVGMSPVEYGKLLWDTWQGDGNCWEQACMAAYIANQQGFKNVFIGSIRSPGDHAFCFIGKEGDVPGMNYKKVRDMLGTPWGAWIVDPWANTCAIVSQYPSFFVSKMDKWTRDGKRVSLSNGAFSGWIEPNNKLYRDGFMDGPLTFEFATAAPPPPKLPPRN